ncbi:MAG: ECF-type sigma factor [Planctomycetota bacterium]
MSESKESLTRVLGEVASGRRENLEELLAAVYNDLRAVARGYLRLERPGHTLQATALVHEAYCRLVRQDEVGWADRAHFFAIASQMIRRILVDHARARKAQKRGGRDRRRLTVSEVDDALARPEVDLVELDDAMHRLAELSPLQAEIVDMRFFGGLTIPEMATVLDRSARTVDREWKCAKAWLYHELAAEGDATGSADGQ